MIIHASAESIREIVPRGTFAVALESPNEERLLKLEEKLIREGISHIAFREPDYDNQLMSVGLEPVSDRRMVRRLLKGFSMYGGNHGT